MFNSKLLNYQRVLSKTSNVKPGLIFTPGPNDCLSGVPIEVWDMSIGVCHHPIGCEAESGRCGGPCCDCRFTGTSTWVCLKMVSTPLYPMVLLIIIPMKNGYFIGNIPYFQTNPHESHVFLGVVKLHMGGQNLYQITTWIHRTGGQQISINQLFQGTWGARVLTHSRSVSEARWFCLEGLVDMLAVASGVQRYVYIRFDQKCLWTQCMGCSGTSGPIAFQRCGPIPRWFIALQQFMF